MSKLITPEELAQIVTKLLTDPAAAGELESPEAYKAFMTSIAQAVCDGCGGEMRNEAAPSDGIWYVAIQGNDSSPEDGGIWAEYDKEGDLFAGK